jgi:alpha-glucosidase
MRVPRMSKRLLSLLVAGVTLTALPAAAPPAPMVRTGTREMPAVTPPPASVFKRFRQRDQEKARQFYKKHIDVKGVPVLASAEVADEALQRTWFIVTRMLAGRPDVLKAMVAHGTRLIIIGKDQVYTDMPEYRNTRNPKFMNERVRGTGGLDVTSFGEENLLNLPIDRYDDESIAVHEFCHTIDAALRQIDPTWRKRLIETRRKAIDNGLWKNTYAATNAAEYWAEICQSFFDCNRINNWNHGPVGTREQFKQYDPEGYDLVRTTFKLTPATDWRYRPLRRQPSVIAPPASFKVHPYYTKFTYAREFTVLGSKQVSDRALLGANDTIRKMFAYRHDVLKAMIADGTRLVVLGRKEKLSDLPEFKEAKSEAGFEVRYLDYDRRRKLMVVGEENVLGLPREPFAGKGMVVSLFARALYQVTALRPAIADFERRRDLQQYELRVKRLDVEFDRKLQKVYDKAMSRKLWRGTAAARDRVEYWVAGVECYFDAAGDGPAANLADRSITTREQLKGYDAELYTLVDETMAYKERVDWRFKREVATAVPRPTRRNFWRQRRRIEYDILTLDGDAERARGLSMSSCLAERALLAVGLALVVLCAVEAAPVPPKDPAIPPKLLVELAVPPLGLPQTDKTKSAAPLEVKSGDADEPDSSFKKTVRHAQVVLWASTTATPPKPLLDQVRKLHKQMKVPPAALQGRYAIPAAGPIAERRFKAQVLAHSQAIARLIALLEDTLEEMNKIETDRDKQSPRWQANHALMRGCLLVRLGHLENYSLALGILRKEFPPHDPKRHRGWRLVPSASIHDSSSKKHIKLAQQILGRLSRDHSGTVWEQQAKQAMRTPAGTQWEAVPRE